MRPPAPLQRPPGPLKGPPEIKYGVGSGEPGGGLAGFPVDSITVPGCGVLLHLRRSLALRDLFQVKMLVLPGPKLFPGGCPVLYLVRSLVTKSANIYLLKEGKRMRLPVVALEGAKEGSWTKCWKAAVAWRHGFCS